MNRLKVLPGVKPTAVNQLTNMLRGASGSGLQVGYIHSPEEETRELRERITAN